MKKCLHLVFIFIFFLLLGKVTKNYLNFKQKAEKTFFQKIFASKPSPVIKML